jgi:hypothetical protein
MFGASFLCGTLKKSLPETKIWLSREFFADMLQATMQERRLHCGKVVAMRRAASGDGAALFEFAVYVAVLIQLFGGLCVIG